MNFKSLRFTGYFKAQHRRRLREYRRIFGLSYREMGRLLCSEWTTVMKWENGECRECNADKLVVLQSFFSRDESWSFYKAIEGCYSDMASRLRGIIQAIESGQDECPGSLDSIAK